MTRPDEFDLDAVFDAARRDLPRMPETLAARIEADGLALLRPRPWWLRALAALGGPAGVGGLVTATCAGLWLGIAPPDAAFDPLVLIGAVETQDELADLLDFGWTSEEG